MERHPVQIPARDLFVYTNQVTVNLCTPWQYNGRGKPLETDPHGKNSFYYNFYNRSGFEGFN